MKQMLDEYLALIILGGVAWGLTFTAAFMAVEGKIIPAVLLQVVNTIVSGLIGYIAKGVIDSAKKEPVSPELGDG